MTKTKKGMIAAIALSGLLLSACGMDNFRDVEGVQSQRPDYIENYNNMDKHPNMGLICIRGAGFVTTTREYNAITRVPEWDDFCKTKTPETHKNN